jgi:hypothetical protein
MPTQSRTTRLPSDLVKAAEIRAERLLYPNWTAYIKGLIRYDLLVQGGHDVTQPWASMPLEKQDQLDAKLLTATENGLGERGQLLRRILAEVKDPANVAEGL